MSTTLEELATLSAEIASNLYPPINTNIAFSWQDPEDFVKDMGNYNPNRSTHDMVTDLSGAKVRWTELEKQLQTEKDKVFRTTITPVGSNANWGRITQPEELQGTTLEELGLNDIKTPERCAEFYQDINDYLFRHRFSLKDKERLIEEGELTSSILPAVEEASIAGESEWLCKGCKKYFATKASLKRHHDRKKSCKEISEKPVVDATVPGKPYIIDWIDDLTRKAISGDSEKPYCKHCDVEFANKSNLQKHLSKSIACDKLAKEDFVKLIFPA